MHAVCWKGRYYPFLCCLTFPMLLVRCCRHGRDWVTGCIAGGWMFGVDSLLINSLTVCCLLFPMYHTWNPFRNHWISLSPGVHRLLICNIRRLGEFLWSQKNNILQGKEHELWSQTGLHKACTFADPFSVYYLWVTGGKLPRQFEFCQPYFFHIHNNESYSSEVNLYRRKECLENTRQKSWHLLGTQNY